MYLPKQVHMNKMKKCQLQQAKIETWYFNPIFRLPQRSAPAETATAKYPRAQTGMRLVQQRWTTLFATKLHSSTNSSIHLNKIWWFCVNYRSDSHHKHRRYAGPAKIKNQRLYLLTQKLELRERNCAIISPVLMKKLGKKWCLQYNYSNLARNSWLAFMKIKLYE